MTELEFSIDRLNSQVMAGKVSLDRMTDAEMAEDMVRLSRDKIVSEGNIALMTQARGINQNLMNTLLRFEQEGEHLHQIFNRQAGE